MHLFVGRARVFLGNWKDFSLSHLSCSSESFLRLRERRRTEKQAMERPGQTAPWPLGPTSYCSGLLWLGDMCPDLLWPRGNSEGSTQIFYQASVFGCVLYCSFVWKALQLFQDCQTWSYPFEVGPRWTWPSPAAPISSATSIRRLPAFPCLSMRCTWIWGSLSPSRTSALSFFPLCLWLGGPHSLQRPFASPSDNCSGIFQRCKLLGEISFWKCAFLILWFPGIRKSAF